MEPPFRSGRPGASARREHARRAARARTRARERFGPFAVFATEPVHVRAWELGALGEERVAARLERLLSSTDAVLLHDRAVPGRRANIDHIAVGPGGVTVIETKRVRGEVRAAGGGILGGSTRLLVDGRDRTAWIASVHRQARAVRDALTASGHAAAPLHGCICLPDPSGLPILGTVQVEGIPVLGPRRLAKRLARDGPFTLIEIDSVAAALAQALPGR